MEKKVFPIGMECFEGNVCCPAMVTKTSEYLPFKPRRMKSPFGREAGILVGNPCRTAH